MLGSLLVRRRGRIDAAGSNFEDGRIASRRLNVSTLDVIQHQQTCLNIDAVAHDRKRPVTRLISTLASPRQASVFTIGVALRWDPPKSRFFPQILAVCFE
jgi:hypothetical protein